MFLQLRTYLLWQNRRSIFSPLAITDAQRPAQQIDIFRAQRDVLMDSKSGAVDQNVKVL